MEQKDKENLVAGIAELALYMTNTILAGIIANSGDDNYVRVMHDAEKNMRCASDFLNAFAGSEVMKF